MRIRKAKPGDVPAIAKVHVDAWLETYRGIVPDVYLNRLSYENRERLWEENIRKYNISVIETEEDGVFGFVTWEDGSTCGEYDSELSSLYILEKYHLRGAGRLLLSSTFREVKEKGHKNLVVRVLSENPARHFYEKMGAEKVKEVTIAMEEKRLTETIYYWVIDGGDHIE
ncbi:GNAT family N-acetyltransferase [Halobacillus litoralis]|uniref:GNAT family N-acetyltransferase n=1 Tax=Halobacillus litoralis TaxID=45668 RepID=A0A845DXX2_9BACI|nr:GNAT family N-acetyltransferase [Halobacillus litoralis]MYL48195.1 GNAT family N-acetyltransferase [Halobacillus litoralis]